MSRVREEDHRLVQEGMRAIVSAMVDFPDQVTIVMTHGETTTLVLIRCAEVDVSRVAGVKGRWRRLLEELLEGPISGARGHRYKIDGIRGY